MTYKRRIFQSTKNKICDFCIKVAKLSVKGKLDSMVIVLACWG
jgi:hypothetical protein